MPGHCTLLPAAVVREAYGSALAQLQHHRIAPSLVQAGCPARQREYRYKHQQHPHELAVALGEALGRALVHLTTSGQTLLRLHQALVQSLLPQRPQQQPQRR